MWFRGVILKKANSPPRITARRGGGVSKKMARSLLIDAAGVVFLVRSIGTPPCPRKKRMLRSIFLIARPPLLVVMRGGEFASLKMAPNMDSLRAGASRSDRKHKLRRGEETKNSSGIKRRRTVMALTTRIEGEQSPPGGSKQEH